MDVVQETVEQCFYGSVTIGERGQLVIPAEARKVCDMQPGDKLLVFRHPHNPHMLMLAKVGELQELLEQLSNAIKEASKHVAEVTEG